jgi:hypothetical protein
MALITVAGPFNEVDARETAKALGSQYNVYSKYDTDSEGYTLESCKWYVEKDDTVIPDKIFGYESKAFLLKQYK